MFTISKDKAKKIRKVFKDNTNIDFKKCEFSIFSQNGEDGIICEIVKRINLNPKDVIFVEFGAEFGDQLNMRFFADFFNASGLFIEADYDRYIMCSEQHRNNKNVKVINSYVTPENINNIVMKEIGDRVDILSIDIDSIDYFIFKSIIFSPKIIIIEYNSSLPRNKKLVCLNESWDGSANFGCSIEALVDLSKEKGYSLIYTDKRGINAFFIRNDLLENFPEHLDPVIHDAKYGIGRDSHPNLDLTQFIEL